MAGSDYDIINLSLEHELNEWLAEKGVVARQYWPRFYSKNGIRSSIPSGVNLPL